MFTLLVLVPLALALSALLQDVVIAPQIQELLTLALAASVITQGLRHALHKSGKAAVWILLAVSVALAAINQLLLAGVPQPNPLSILGFASAIAIGAVVFYKLLVSKLIPDPETSAV